MNQEERKQAIAFVRDLCKTESPLRLQGRYCDGCGLYTLLPVQSIPHILRCGECKYQITVIVYDPKTDRRNTVKAETQKRKAAIRPVEKLRVSETDRSAVLADKGTKVDCRFRVEDKIVRRKRPSVSGRGSRRIRRNGKQGSKP